MKLFLGVRGGGLFNPSKWELGRLRGSCIVRRARRGALRSCRRPGRTAAARQGADTSSCAVSPGWAREPSWACSWLLAPL